MNNCKANVFFSRDGIGGSFLAAYKYKNKNILINRNYYDIIQNVMITVL
jgi:hypothetical protein